MKTIILFFSALIIAQTSFCQINLDSIKFTYVRCYATTIISTPCERFDAQFETIPNQKKYKVIKDSEITAFAKILQKFVKIKSNSMDVRGKIEFISKGEKNKFCFDGSGRFTDGSYFYKNARLSKLIKKEIPDFCN